MPFRIGLIGCGVVTTKAHLPGLIRDPRFTISALCRRQVAELIPLQSQFPHARVFSSAEDLVQSGVVDCLLVATDVTSHLALAQLAVDHGLFALIEKPLDSSANRIRAFIQQNSHGLERLIIAFNKRFYPGTTKLKALQATGQLSNLVGGNLIFLAAQGRKHGRAGVMQNLIHTCDLLIHIFGKPVNVRAHFSSQLNDPLKGKTISATILTEHGCCVSLFFTSSSNWKIPVHERIEVLDDKYNKILVEDADFVLMSKHDTESDPDEWGNYPMINTVFHESNSIFFRSNSHGYDAQIARFGDLMEGKLTPELANVNNVLQAHELFEDILAYDVQQPANHPIKSDATTGNDHPSSL